MNFTNIAGRNFQNHCPKLANSIAISGSQGTSTYPIWIGAICAPPPDCKHPSFCRQITEVLNDSNLIQTVSRPTRDSNILDLFFTTNPTLVQRVSILPGISIMTLFKSKSIPLQKFFFRNHGLYPYTKRQTGIG